MPMLEYNEQSNRVWLEASEVTPVILLEEVREALRLYPGADIYISMLSVPMWQYRSYWYPIYPYGVTICYSNSLAKGQV